MKTRSTFKILSALFIFLFANTIVMGQQLVEKANLLGIDHTFQPRGLMGGGAVFFDFDLDGDEDLYLVSGLVKDVMYRNNGDGTFSKVLEDIGLNVTQQYNTTAVITGDIDNDGDREIFVSTWERFEGGDITARNLFFLNNGDGTFTEIGESAGIVQPAFTIGANFIDFDRDGFLDIYVLNHVESPAFLYDMNGAIVGFDHDCYPNFFYKNNGDGTFTEMANELGLDDLSCTLAAIASDFDMDGDVDLYLANDFGPFIVPNLFFENQYPNAGFVENSTNNGTDVAMYGMGVAAGDYDHDGDFDYYITNLGSNVLLENDNATFTDVATNAGVENEFSASGSEFATGWGTAFMDVDNDTWEDLFVANGRIPSLPSLPTGFNDPNKLFMNNGDKTFTDVSEQVGVDDTGYGRGMAYADFDQDGDLDFVLINQNELGGTTKFYVNETETDHHYVQFQLRGTDSNYDAYGAKLWLYVDDQVYLREISGGGDSFCSQHSSIAHFGLGDYTQIDSLSVEWPSGQVKNYGAFAIDARHLIIEESTTSIATLAENRQEFLVMPNPFQNEIILQSQNNLHQEVRVALWDINNKLIKTYTIDWSGDQQKLNLPDALPKGLYLLRIQSNDQVWTSRVIKQ